MRAASSSIAGIIGAELTIEWFPRLSPHMDGSAFSGHYLGGWVARPLNGLAHEPFLDPHRTVRAPHIETKYGAKKQYAEYDTSAPVGKDEHKHVQQVTGKFN